MSDDTQIMLIDMAEQSFREAAGALHVAIGRYTALVISYKDVDQEYVVGEAWKDVRRAEERLLFSWSALERRRNAK